MQKEQSKSYTIRTATSADAHAIAEIHVIGWQTTYRGHMPDDVLDSLSVTEREQQWRERIEKFECEALVAEFNHTIVGFVSFCPCRDDDVESTKTGEISALYLSPECKGQGLGYKLMVQALDILHQQKYQDVVLWVLAANKNACHFYKKMGFHLDQTKTNPDRIAGAVLCDYRYRKRVTMQRRVPM